MSIATLIITQLRSDWLSVFLVLLATYVCHFYYKYYTRSNPLPGVVPLPFVGNLLHTGWDLPRWANNSQAKFGDVWEIWIGNERSIFLGNAKLIDKIYMAKKNNNFTLRTLENSGHVEYGLSDKGIILNRVSWQYNRQLLQQCVTSQKYYRDFVVTTQKCFEEVEKYWTKLGNKSQINFAAWSMRMVTDVTVVMSTGKPAYQCAIYYNNLVKSPADRIDHPQSVFKTKGDFVSSITQWFYTVQFSYFFPTWIRHYVPGFSWYNGKCKKNSQWLTSTLMGIIEERKEEIKTTPLDQPLSSDILTVLMTTNTDRDMNKISSKYGFDRPMTDAEIAENLTEVFAAGIDTTANSLTFMVFNICKYAHVKARLLSEINSIFGEGPITRQITPEDLDKLKYVDSFIKETARTTPVVPLLVKTASTDDTVIGLEWEAGTQFYANVHGIHMNASSWDKPNEFNPDRFMGEEPEKYSLLQFGGGLRVCPGRQMAIYELKCLLVLLLKRYEFELENKTDPLKYKFGMIHHCDNLGVYLSPKVY